ncbi:MAG: hypothetical protein AAGK67_15900 [Pseudomonadota bacterium]
MSKDPDNGWSLGGLAGKLREQVGQLSLPDLPKLGREVEMPVYLVHNSEDAEDYFFIFDFERFVEESQSGVFVRPKMTIWAGRDDFDRRLFARSMRESFAQEFEIARAQLMAQKDKPRGWFSFLTSSFGEATSLASFVSNLVLLIGLSAGKMVLSQVLPRGWLQGKTDEQRLEKGIDETKSKVDAALESIDITLHIELYRHAYHGQAPGRLSGMDYDAWPLPGHVRQHLQPGAY